MTLDLTLKEIEDRFDRAASIHLSARIKERGMFNQSACAKFNNDWMKEISKLPEEIIGMYLQIRSIVDYAIENVNNHGGDSIDISLSYTPSEVLVTVADNGFGFDVANTLKKFQNSGKYYQFSGIGLRRMEESHARVVKPKYLNISCHIL